MQDIHSICGGSAGGSRRLRVAGNHALTITNLNSHYHHHHHHQGALKCPRCDSLNTKFCYYNNYNLSQPRHFCKSCRRYWTNGGVLRNVPVGGGCRKSKRSSSNSKSKRHHRSPSPPVTAAPSCAPPLPQPSSNSHSSSESTSHTAAEAVSSGLSCLGGASLHQGGISRPAGAVFDQPTGPLFSGLSGLSTFMPSSSSDRVDTGLNFGFHSLLINQQPQPQPPPLHTQHQAQAMPWSQPKVGAGELEDYQKDSVIGFFDWQGSCGGAGPVDQSFFDLPLINTVDNSFWNQTHWNSTTVAGGDHLDHQNNIYLP